MKRLPLFFLCWCCTKILAQEFYKSNDFTHENLFTENCEGPAVDKRGNLYVVNFQNDGTIGKIKMDGRAELYLTLPAGSIANAIQFAKNGDMLLADFTGHNILKVDSKTKKISVLVHSDLFNQPNDIAINTKGQLFASDPNWKDSSGKLWRIEPNGKLTLLEEKMGTTNGIELSPDEKTLYVNESLQRAIWAYDLDDKGNSSNKRKFFQFTDFGLDGMKCDAQGNLLVARHGKGVIAIFNSDGKILREVALKGKKVSNICFGGKDGKTCYVTMQDRKCVETFRHDVAGRKFKRQER
ncbi:MAG TPA: gluconolactonase [Cytophagales bacterium]|jgi:gluconolactonase|nr:gluconolactonase [Cytophagales bacterium]